MNANTNRVLDFAGRIAYSHFEIVEHVYKTALKLGLDGTPGSFVECGVAAGSKIIAMAQGLIDSGNPERRTIYAYDSFEGIPLPTKGDDQKPGIEFLSEEQLANLPDPQETDKFLTSSGATVHSLENFWSNVQAANIGYSAGDPGLTNNINTEIRLLKDTPISIESIKGWFEKTVQWHKSKGDIAYLRLDGDMYSATKVCLENLYPKLVSGGILEIDDYALAGCRKAVDEYFEGQKIEWITVHPNSTVVYMQKK